MARPNSQARRAPAAERSGPFVVKSDADVLGLRTLGALGEIELDLLTLVEGLVAAGLDGGEVDEHVLAAAILRDEAETLLGVEPLDSSLSHDLFPCSVPGAPCPQAAEDIHPVLVSSEPKPELRDTSRDYVRGQDGLQGHPFNRTHRSPPDRSHVRRGVHGARRMTTR